MKSIYKSNTFMVEIKSTKNESWQGTIRWIDGKKEENFRSALELIKLIDSALDSQERSDKI